MRSATQSRPRLLESRIWKRLGHAGAALASFRFPLPDASSSSRGETPPWATDVLCRANAGFGVEKSVLPAICWVARRSGRGPGGVRMVT
jgi:hypothetical protein